MNYRVLNCVFSTIFALIVLFTPASVMAEDEWTVIEGPTVADVGEDLADIKVPEGYFFLPAKETQVLMESMGNQADELTLGYIAPNNKEEDWFIVFEYMPVGYIEDDEKDDLDADALLKDLREGNEAGNKWREENGFSTLELLGWHTKPRYDEETKCLVWATDNQSEEEGEVYRVLNYNMRILGREGYMSAILVADPEDLDKIKPEVHELIDGFDYKQGKRYAEFRKGDKVAKLGLAALIAGGAGAVAVKTGLFTVLLKYLKFIVIGLAGALAAFKNKIASLFGKKD